MSYCRMSGDSDIYLYPDVHGYIVCMGCCMTSVTVYLATPEKALEHIQLHRKIGDKVPMYADERLLKEIEERVHEIDTT
jgi:hypothetical protein